MVQNYSTIDIFNKCRRHLFSIYNKYGDLDNAINYVLKGSLYALDKRSIVGLEAELKIYDKHKNDWDLTPTLDCGDHTDFTGFINKEQVRLDVTTNVEFKKLEDYEKFQKEGKRYFIVYFNRRTEEAELIDINFPFCDCGGRLMKMVVLEDLNTTEIYSGSSITQSLITVCSHNPQEHFSVEKDYNYIITSSVAIDEAVKDSFAIELEDHNIDGIRRMKAQKEYESEVENQIRGRFNHVANFFKTECDSPISVIGEECYHMTDPRDGDGYNDTLVVWSSDIVKRHFQPNNWL